MEMNEKDDVFNEETGDMEKRAMNEMDDLVNLFRGRATKSRLMQREHDRMMHMVRNQEEKIQVLQMRQEHVNDLLTQLQEKLEHAPTDEHRFVLKDQCAALMKELRHLQNALERNQMMLAKFKNEAQARELEIQSMQQSQRRTREKAEALNEKLPIEAEEMESHDFIRREVLNALKAKLRDLDTETLKKILQMIDGDKMEDAFAQKDALVAIEPKIRLIRESNLYSMLTDPNKERIDVMIQDYVNRIRGCPEAQLLKHFVNDFEKIAFSRIFRKMAECIQ